MRLGYVHLPILRKTLMHRSRNVVHSSTSILTLLTAPPETEYNYAIQDPSDGFKYIYWALNLTREHYTRRPYNPRYNHV